MIQQYVTFLFPGSFMPNEQTIKINSRNQKIDIPATCFAYYFWERQEIQSGEETLYGEQKNKSGRYYFGKEMTAADVAREVPDNSILLSNMRINKWDKVVRTRRGNFQPLDTGDVIVSE